MLFERWISDHILFHLFLAKHLIEFLRAVNGVEIRRVFEFELPYIHPQKTTDLSFLLQDLMVFGCGYFDDQINVGIRLSTNAHRAAVIEEVDGDVIMVRSGRQHGGSIASEDKNENEGQRGYHRNSPIRNSQSEIFH